MRRNRLLGILLLVLVLPVVLIALTSGLITDVRDFTNQIFGAIVIGLLFTGASLLSRGWSSTEPKPEPDLKIVNPRYRGGGFHGKIQNSWSWVLILRNDGLRDGEIRDFTVKIAEIEPTNLGLTLNHSFATVGVNGLQRKESSKQVDLSIRYANQGPEWHPVHAMVTRLVANLTWEKETLKGFESDSLQLTLVPAPSQ
ncbi:MAG: hypothetical protein ABSC50_10955 [Candidatus Bathyarchaeia archaeon]